MMTLSLLRHGLKRTLSAIRFVAAAWVVTCFVVMAVSVWLQVGGRYLFNYSISWTGELATIAQIWAVLVGAGIAARRNMHARIDVLVNMFPVHVRRGMTVITLLLGLWFLAAIVVGTFPMMSLGRFQTTPALGIPLLFPYLGLIVGPIYFGVELIAAAVASWSAVGQEHADPADISL